MVIPIENSFLYVEPVFLLAEGVDIPQLQRVIVAIGEDISMQPTMEAAMIDLFGEVAGLESAPMRTSTTDVDLTPEELANQRNLEADQ